jgi:hypothetical protein
VTDNPEVHLNGAQRRLERMQELEQENTRLRNAIIDVLREPNLAMSVCSALREAIGERNG